MPKVSSPDSDSQELVELTWVFGPRGAADASTSNIGSLFGWQFAISLLAGLITGWLAWRVACPVVQQGIQNLPGGIVRISSGHLDWPEPVGRRLSENGFLALAVDPAGDAAISHAADLQCTFGPTHVTASGLLGSLPIRYPMAVRLAFDRIDALAWWGAWKWVCLLSILLGTQVILLVAWWMLAAIHAVPAWLLAKLSGRRLTITGAGKLAGASLLSGAIVMCGGLLLYGLRLIAVPGLTVATGLHVLASWSALLGGVVHLPNRAARGASPFTPPPSVPIVVAFARTPDAAGGDNPFSDSRPPD